VHNLIDGNVPMVFVLSMVNRQRKQGKLLYLDARLIIQFPNMPVTTPYIQHEDSKQTSPHTSRPHSLV
jgi:hypothetical protein